MTADEAVPRAAGSSVNGIEKRNFAGWAKLAPPVPDGALQAMFERSPGTGGHVALGPSLAAKGIPAGLGAQVEGVSACILGQPRWTDTALAAQARADGHAQTLIAAYRRYGRDLLAHLGGQFALAIVADDGSEALFAVDRLGCEELNFRRHQGGVLFASHASLMQGFPGIEERLSAQGVYDYLYFHVLPIPDGAFEGVERLGPGEYLHLSRHGEKRGLYAYTTYRPQRKLGFEDARQEFRELLDDAVGEYLHDDREVGAFLSGGTDSSTLAGTLGKVSGRPPRCFSIGFDAPGFDEIEYARIAAKRFNAEHHVYYIRPEDIVSAIPEIARFSDAPFGNSSVVPALFCARLARDQGIELLLGGDGGDELFGGNERYGDLRLYTPWEATPGPLRGLIDMVVNGLPGGQALWPIRKARSYVEAARIPMPDRTQRYNLLHRLGAERVLHPDFLAAVDQEHPLELLREVYWGADSASDLNRYLAMDMKFTLADNDLPKVNIACALGGVEVGYPLLDDRLLEFAARLPEDFKLRKGRLRWFFKEALADFLPQEIIHKRKHGFGLPFGLWMNEHAPLRELVDDSLTGLRGRGIVNPEFIDELLGPLMREHASYYGVAVWILVMLEQWLRAHGDMGLVK